jgi:hypothetical protein
MDGCHQAFQHGIEELAGLFRIAVGQEFQRAFEVGKQHGNVLALTFEGAFGGEDFLRQIGRGVGKWGRFSLRNWSARRASRRRLRSAGPDQHGPLLIGRETLTVDEFNLEIIEGRVIELELPLERAIGHAAPLAQQCNHLIHDRDKVHRVSSLPGVRLPYSCATPS